jgi:hypothetical protein
MAGLIRIERGAPTLADRVALVRDFRASSSNVHAVAAAIHLVRDWLSRTTFCSRVRTATS